MAEPITSPRELFATRLRQMLWIELTLADEVLPELLESAHSTDLRYGFDRHLLETRRHVEVVRGVLDELGVHAEPEESPALQGLVREHEQLVERAGENALVLDLAHAQGAAATEHLEMASYDALASTAEALGEEEIGTTLRELMEQEEHALELVERAQAKLLAEQVESERN
ncbi:MAG: ferritin-like domain-containing protein [Gaiellaceae bacterium]